MIDNFIKLLRLKNRYTQEYVANILGISRQSYTILEKNDSKIRMEQIEKLSNLYNMSKSDFVNQKERNIDVNVISKGENIEKNNKNSDIRINIPQRNMDKFKQVLLYILSNVGAKPNVGQVVLYKLLYFIDFDFYEKYEEQLIGITYIKNNYGPTPVEFKKLIDDMKNNKELKEVKIKYFNYQQTKYLPLKEYNIKDLSALEIQHINEELNRLSDKSATELSDLSHKDVPWIIAKEQEEIDYESVFYRTSETSVRRYDNL